MKSFASKLIAALLFVAIVIYASIKLVGTFDRPESTLDTTSASFQNLNTLQKEARKTTDSLKEQNARYERLKDRVK